MNKVITIRALLLVFVVTVVFSQAVGWAVFFVLGPKAAFVFKIITLFIVVVPMGIASWVWRWCFIPHEQVWPWVKWEDASEQSKRFSRFSCIGICLILAMGVDVFIGIMEFAPYLNKTVLPDEIIGTPVINH